MLGNISTHEAKGLHWRALLAEQVASGLTIRDFCKDRSINRSTFQYWCDKFFREDQNSAAQKSTVKNPPSRFIPIAASKNTLPRFPTPRILLPNGVAIELNRSFDDPGVSSFLKALCGINRELSQK